MMRLVCVFALLTTACNDSPAECTKLELDLENAVNAFVPTSANSCTTDADCSVADATVTVDGQSCFSGCDTERSANAAYATEFRDYLDHDATVTGTCRSLLSGGCHNLPPPCPCGLHNGVSCTPQCIDGTCQ